MLKGLILQCRETGGPGRWNAYPAQAGGRRSALQLSGPLPAAARTLHRFVDSAYGIFRQEEKGSIPKIDGVMLEKCYRCGRCVAICPAGAISHSHFQEGTVNPIRPESLPSYDQLLELIRSRRSKRLFRDTPVERDVPEKVLEAARFAPSQHNDQSTEFLVIQDKKFLNEIAALTAESLGQSRGGPIPGRFALAAPGSE